MRHLKDESACNIEQAIDLTSAVVELHRLGSQELNKLLRDSEIFTIQRCTEKGSSVQVDMERLAWSLPLHLIAVLVSPGGDETRLRYLLCGFRLLHCLSDLAHRHSKLEQILLEEVKITEQIMDLVFYMLTVLARYEHVKKENNVPSFLPLLHSTLVACSFHLLTGYISSQWQELAHVLVAHPKVDVFMDVAFHAVHIDIKFLQIKLFALNDDLIQKNPAAAEKIAHILCQQCEASLQFLHSLCQQKLFRERLLRNKELCKNGGILSLARAVLRLDISSRFGESSNVVVVVSRLKSKVLSILLQLCETESISYLDEVASSQRSMKLAKCTVLEIVELLKTAFGQKSRQSNNCVGNSNPRGLVHLNSMRLTDIFSDDSNFRYFITTNITHVLVEILSLPHEEFFSSWCSTDHQVVEEDASIEYDPFVAAGVVLATLPMEFETSFPPNVTNTERNFTVNRVRQTSYVQQRTSLLVKIIANLHCFVPNICEEQERDLFFNKFLECLQMELPKSSSLITYDTYKPRAITVYQNLCSLLDHAASLIPNFLNEEDVQLLSKFLEQLQIQITPPQFEANSDQKQIQENNIEGPLLWNKFPNPDVGERHKGWGEARNRGEYASFFTRKVDAKGWGEASYLRHKNGDLKEGISESSPHQDGSMEMGRSIGKRTSRSPEPLREIDKDVGNVETSGSDASSTRGNNSHDQTLDNDDLTKLATNCENGRNETTNCVVKQRRKRKRKIMNSRQVSLIEHALLDEPEMQRNAPMLQSWAEKLSTHGSHLTPSQLKNWLNNRKARLARQAKETRTPSEGDIAFPDRSSGGILGHFYYDSPESPSEEYYVPATTRRGTNQSTPNVGVVTLKTRSNETSEIATTDLVDCKSHQNMQMNSTSSRYVRCNPGQKVSLTDVEGKEVCRGKVYQVEGRWDGKNLEEARIHIVDVHELKVEGRTSLPHPSEAAGTTFSEAVDKNGVMRVAWDASNILVLPQ